MKKILLMSAFVAISTAALCQSWLYTETIETKFIEDMNVGIEKVRTAANESFKQNNITDPLTKALSLKIAESTYKKTYKKMLEERFVTNYPDGAFSIYGKLDVPGDRVVFFCPQLGRIIMQDFKNRKQYIIFPKLDTYLQNDIDKSVPSVVASYLATAPIPEFAKSRLTDLNGFRALGNCTLVLATDATLPENIVELNGQKCELLPLPGYALVEPGDNVFHSGIYVEALIGDGVNEGTRHLVQWEEGTVDPANFEIPAGLAPAKDFKTLNKTVQAAVSSDKIAVPDPGCNPEIFWDCFK